MKLQKVIIEDFGVYSGVNEFNLKIHIDPDGDTKNLIIITGPNGWAKVLFLNLLL